MLAQRIFTAVVLGVGALASILLLPTQWLAAVFAIVWLAGAWEWARFGGWQGGARLAYAAVLAILMALAHLSNFDPRWLFYAAAVWWLLAFVWVLRYPTPIAGGLVTAIGILVLVPSWCGLIYLHGQPQGAGLVITVLGIVAGADVGAYFAGRLWGRHKLAPAVSPKKTWEGVGGGLVLAGLVSAGAAWSLGLNPGVLLVIGALCAAISIVGDLSVSMFKRNLGIKDSSNLLPGHGGVMDRIDSLSAAAPCFCLAMIAVGAIAL